MKRPPSRAPFVVGVILTITYLGGISWYWQGDVSALLTLSPNEFGDFLAGTFAPLAFLWLVLGFVQQGDELRNSADALWLQGEELQHSVEQQRELVNVTREQLLFEGEMLTQQREEIARNSQPIFRLMPGGSMGAGKGERLYTFHLFNHGKTCTDLTVQVAPSGQQFRASSLATGTKFDFNLTLPIGPVSPFDVVVTYLDERLLRGSKRFTLAAENARFDISEAGEA